MKYETNGTTQDKILYQIKRLGPQSAKSLAQQLGITTMGIRQHLGQLEADELVRAGAPNQQKRGRPVKTWHLTAAGHARFPDAHAQVTTELIASVRDLLGEEALDRVIRQRAEASHSTYASAMEGADTLEGKVDALAELRSAEGYMAEVEKVSAEEFLLIENHCPICIAAESCQGFCRTELESFQRLLEEHADVEREDYLLDGARRCTYRIRGISSRR